VTFFMPSPNINNYRVTTHNACTTPGKNTSKQSTMFIIKSFPAPFFRKTATGGRKIASIICSNLDESLMEVLPS
jgi:hypothetical protein